MDNGAGCDVQAPMAEMPRPTRGVLAPASDDRQLVIGRALNGFVVIVGCKTVVFETREKLLSELDRYLKNPQQVENEYMGRK